MKMKFAEYNGITIIAWDKKAWTVTIVDDGRKSTCKIRDHESGDPEKSFIIHKKKRYFLYQFHAEPCDGTFLHHFKYDNEA